MLYWAWNLISKLSKYSDFQTLASRHSSRLPDDVTETNSRSGTEKKTSRLRRGRGWGKGEKYILVPIAIFSSLPRPSRLEALERFLAMPGYEACANAWKQLLSKRFLVSVTYPDGPQFLSFFSPPPPLQSRAGDKACSHPPHRLKRPG